MKDEPRDSETWVAVGFTGSGKTSYILKLVKGRRVIIISYAAQDRGLSDVEVIEVEDLKRLLPGPRVVRVNALRADKSIYDILAEVQKYIFGSVLILDDTKSEVGSNPGSDFTRALGAVRHNGNELFLTYWSINHPPPFVYDMAGHILLFKTQQNDIRALHKVPRASEVIAAYNWIQSDQAPNFSHAHIVLNPMNKLSHKPFFKVYPKKAA